MANKSIFQSQSNLIVNEAGGNAYELSAEEALSQYALTGTFNQTFYTSEEKHLEKVLELCKQVSPQFIAKLAVYARQKAYMKDVPAFLCAYLAGKDVKLLKKVFPLVIDNGKMLRNFVQIIRSGVVGRKSFGTAPKKLVQRWFSEKTVEQIFMQSTGSAPSIKDVLKLTRPSPIIDGKKDLQREALYGYLIDKEVSPDSLPEIVKVYEEFKKNPSTALPNVPMEMLTGLLTSTEQWQELAKKMSWTQLRMSLNTLNRHGAFSGESGIELEKEVCGKLSNPDLIKKAKVFPYQLLMAYKASKDIPMSLTNSLQDAMEVATENVPSIEGQVYVCPDVSGSMHSPVTGQRQGGTTAVQCIDVAALISAAFIRTNNSAKVIPFSDNVVKLPRKLNPRDSVMSNADFLSNLPSGGTNCAAPLAHLNAEEATGDLVIFVSDNMSWVDFQDQEITSWSNQRRNTSMSNEWQTYKKRNPNAKLVLIDIQPSTTTQVQSDKDVLNIGGFSDSVFDIINAFVKNELDGKNLVKNIKNLSI